MTDLTTQIAGISRSLAHIGLGRQAIDDVIAVIDRHLAGLSAPPTLAQVARGFLKGSIRRSDHFGQKLVADTAWNMLLELFAAHEEGREVSVSSLCFASGSPASTALRHLNMMVDRKLVGRCDHESDGRRVRVWIMPETHATMCDLLVGFCVCPPMAR